MKKSVLISLFIFFTFSSYSYNGLLRVSGKNIVDADNTNVLLRGINLGNWLVNEAYMMNTPSSTMGLEREMRIEMLNVLGGDQTKLDAFYAAFHTNYVQKIDIDKIDEWGMNSIRLPLDETKLGTYNSTTQVYTINEKGFAQIDSVLKWARPHNIYVILDMHRLPGGGHAAMDEFWASATLQDHFVAAWRVIANRYKNDDLVAGYDLINEPNHDFADNNLNKPLLNILKRATTAIREVDNRHIVFVEGNGYSWDFRGLKVPWDANMVYAFHKYISSWQVGDYDVNEMVALRNGTNRPVWNGETGENSNLWLTNMAKRYEAENIGWSVWPAKKFGSVVGPLAVPISPLYAALCNYWNYKADTTKPYVAKPSAADAYTALMAQAELCKFANCTFRKDYIDAIMRQTKTDTIIPWKAVILPEIVGRTTKINASEFDMGVVGSAYQTSQRDWNNAYAFRNDEINVLSQSGEANGYVVGNIHSDNSIGKDEWTKYTVTTPLKGKYEVRLRYWASTTTSAPAVNLTINAKQLLTSNYLLKADTKFNTELLGEIDIEKGKTVIILNYIGTDYKVSTIDFKLKEILPTALENTTLNPLRILRNANEITLADGLQSPATIQIFNQLGQVIFKKKTNDITNFSFTCGNQKGIYFVSVQYITGEKQIQKFQIY